MKKFISFAPRQPKDKLMETAYEAKDNQRLRYEDADHNLRKTHFPIVNVINGYAQPGEEIQVLAFTEEYQNSKDNVEFLKAEVSALCAEKGLELVGGGVEVIMVPYGDGVGEQLEVFQKVIDRIDDGDTLYACITYGSKPTPIVELMAMRYARQIRKNVYVECVAYGGVDFNTNQACIYDETALVHLDDIVRVLAEHHVANPQETLKQILAL